MKTIDSPKFAFYYLLSLVTLVFTAISTGTIIFQYINKYIKDDLDLYSGQFSQDGLKFAISALIIATPIFFIITRLIFKNLDKGQLDSGSPLRRWLTYFILLVASVVMIGWFIAVLNNFFNGELTLKFILKTLTALSIAGAIFSFYLYDIRREQIGKTKDPIMASFAYGSLGAVVLVFLAALFIVESPTETRLRKFDEATINELSTLESGIENYYSIFDRLPLDLNELNAEIDFITDESLNETASGETYGYSVVGDREYELCANFRLSNQATDNQRDQWTKQSWPHGEGRVCFSKKVQSKGIETMPLKKIEQAP